MDVWVGGWMDGCVDGGWMRLGRWDVGDMAGWMGLGRGASEGIREEWLDGWMDGWMNGQGS